MDETYNGWTNRATWNLMLWLGNDEGLESSARRIARRTTTTTDLRRDIEALFDTIDGEPVTPDGDRLADVDWEEVQSALEEWG
jgi:hypothetical protein